MHLYWKNFDTVRIAGVRIAVASRKDLVSAAVHDCALEGARSLPRLVFDANGHGVSLAANDLEFAHALSQADLIHADGGFIVTASRIMGGPVIPERSATTDMIHDLAQTNLTHYLLGATEEVNAEAARILQQTYPTMRIAGRHNGYFSLADEDEIVRAINEAAPEVLWVGLGKPLEQSFCLRNRHRLQVPWIITCGGCYNYITGAYPRAPRWMQKANLEWLHRLATNPKRLGWRYLTTTPHALWLAATRSGVASS